MKLSSFLKLSKISADVKIVSPTVEKAATVLRHNVVKFVTSDRAEYMWKSDTTDRCLFLLAAEIAGKAHQSVKRAFVALCSGH